MMFRGKTVNFLDVPGTLKLTASLHQKKKTGKGDSGFGNHHL